MNTIAAMKVTGLFGYRDIELSFNDSRTVIFTGLNGAGKSHILKLLHGGVSKSRNLLESIQFKTLDIEFEDGSIEHFEKDSSGELAGNGLLDNIEPRLGGLGGEYHFGLGHNGISIGKSIQGYAARGMNLPFRKNRREESRSIYIDADRLIVNRSHLELRGENEMDPTTIATTLYFSYLRSEFVRTFRQIEQKRSKLQSTLSERLIPRMAESVPTPKQLETKFEHIKTNLALCESGGIQLDESVPNFKDVLAEHKKGAPSLKRVLDQIYDDQLEALSVAVPFASRVGVLIDILNSSFLDSGKRVELKPVDQSILRRPFGPEESPLEICYENGVPIQPDSLSSGEKNLIALYLPIVLRPLNGGYVLVDEPEISLHPKWQLELLPNLEKIRALSDFQVLIATHSPTIIDGQWDLECSVPMGIPPSNSSPYEVDLLFNEVDIDEFEE